MPWEGGPAACNALPLSGAPVRIVQSTGTAGSARGGVIAPGTYALASVVWFNGQTGPLPSVLQVTLRFQDATLESASRSSGPVDRASYAWKTYGDRMDVAEWCPGSANDGVRYTATANQLVMYIDDGQGGVVEEVYIKQ